MRHHILSRCLLAVAGGLACQATSSTPHPSSYPSFAIIHLVGQAPLVLGQAFQATGYTVGSTMYADFDPEGALETVSFGPGSGTDSLRTIIVILDSNRTISSFWLRFSDSLPGDALLARYRTAFGPSLSTPTSASCHEWIHGPAKLVLCPDPKGGGLAFISRSHS